MRFPLAALCAALLLALAGCGDDSGDGTDSPRHVTLALDFQPNAVHAGIYAASERRIDREHGLDLRIRVPSSSTDSLKLLAAGRADASIVDIHDLGLASERGADVVGIGALVQRPLAAIIARPNIRRPRELEGRRVGVTGLPSDDAVLRAAVEADVTFWNAEGVALRRRGVPTRQFRVDRYGAPRYPELVLATTSERLAEDSDLLRDLVAKLADDTDAALENRPRTVEEIASASDSDEALVAAQLRAVAPALTPPLELDPDALRDWAAFDAEFGILEREPDVGALFPTDLTD